MGAGIVRRLMSQGEQILGLDLENAAWPEDLELVERFQVDVSQQRSVDLAIESSTAALDGIDAVVNCAGILGPVKPLVKTASSEFFQLLNVNLLGAFHVTGAALKVMQPKGYGRIVHIASIAGKEGNPGMAGYSASKAGIIGMVKAAGKEVADSGVTINAIAPASIETPLIMGMTPERREAQKSLIPVGRFGTVEEVAALVEYVISPEASFTTGFTFDMSGGRAVY
jgi:3-oxoacyl-[acyl-carrier protein] reductase